MWPAPPLAAGHASEAEPPEPDDPFHVGEDHPDLLAVLGGLLEGFCLADHPCAVAGGRGGAASGGSLTQPIAAA